MKENVRRRKKNRLGDVSGYIYILPATLFIVLFAIIPIFVSVYYSFTKFNVLQPPEWVGMKNYQAIAKDPYMKAAFRNTLIYTLLVVPLTTILSMMIAALITSRKRTFFIGAVKSMMFVPVISSAILVGTLWRIMYNPQIGLINQFIGLFGIKPINWLGESKLALPSVCLVGLWKNIGYFMVIYIAAIYDIPNDLYEAASLDGASGWQKFCKITLPMLKPTTFLVVVLSTIWSFQVFDTVYMMTGGGPGRSTITLVYYIYNNAFRDYRMGYACAVSVVLFVLIVIFSLIQKVALRDKEDRG